MTAESWNERYRQRELVWRSEPNVFLVEEVDHLEPGRALDLGCGEGRNAVWLAQQGWTVTAVDFSDVGIEKGRAMAAERGVEVEWIVADLLEYVPPAGQFDLVIDFYIHLPAEQRRDLLAKASRALATGGTLIVVGHDRTNLEDGYGGPQDPDLLHSPEEISAGLPDLRVVRAERVFRTVETETGTVRAVDSLVRAIRR